MPSHSAAMKTPFSRHIAYAAQSHSILVDPRWAPVVVLSPRQEPLTDPAVHHKDGLRGHLRPQECRLLHARVGRLFPLGEVLRRLHCPDARWRLVVSTVSMELAGVKAPGSDSGHLQSLRWLHLKLLVRVLRRSNE